MHRRGLAHRDMSLENSMLDASDDVKVIDFGVGVAMPAPHGGVVAEEVRPGKPGYMAPEVCVCVCVYVLFARDFVRYFGHTPCHATRAFEALSYDSVSGSLHSSYSGSRC